MNTIMILRRCGTVIALSALCACNAVSNAINPYYEPPAPVAVLGEPNDHALNGEEKIDTARQAFEVWSQYDRTQTPQPYHPVVQPAVVRMMWIPDHMNSHNDLVPAHYYYLKVLNDSFNVRDGFELEDRLGGAGGVAGVPYVREGSSVGSK